MSHDVKYTAEFYALVSPWFDIEVGNLIFHMKLGQYEEMNNILLLMGFELKPLGDRKSYWRIAKSREKLQEIEKNLALLQKLTEINF